MQTNRHISRGRFTCGLGGAVSIWARGGLANAASTERTKRVALDAGIDGIVIRGRWRARVELGVPGVTIVADDDTMREIVMTRNATTLTIAQSTSLSGEREPELSVALARLRGIATSGAVLLTIVDRSDSPLFLDLSGAAGVRAVGAVPLLRVTTSGSVTADVTRLLAVDARVHARQSSRLAVSARRSLNVVAVDAAHVTYEGSSDVRITRRNAAVVIGRNLDAPSKL
jgi:hypothetical protein